MKMNTLDTLKANLSIIILLLLAAFVFFVGVYGVDVGRHGDESALTFPLITKAIESGRIALPGVYFYPSMWHNLSLTALLPETLAFLSTVDPRNLRESIFYNDLKNYLAEVSQQTSFQFRIRGIFTAVSALSVFWLYFLVLKIRQNKWEALLASVLLGLSWEIGYHMRWVIPHIVMMQFAVLTMMFVAFAHRAKEHKKRKLWLYLASAAAGLTTGTLYNGGAFIIPVIFAFYFYSKKINLPRETFWKQAGVLLAVFAAVYLISTPGTLLDPVRFADNLLYEFKAYAIRGGIYTVTSFEHAYLLLGYFAFAVFSPFVLISLFFSAASTFGIYAFIKEDKELAYIFLAPLAVFLVFLISLNTMYVRNFLPLFPFFAMFSARGIFYFYEKYLTRFSPKPFHFLFIGLITFMLLVNGAWSFTAAKSIAQKHETNYAEQLLKYINKHSGREFAVSQAVQKELLELEETLPPNVKSEPVSQDALVVFRSFELFFSNKTREEIAKDETTTITQKAQEALDYSFEHDPNYIATDGDWDSWTPNRFNYTKTWFGPYEVNFNYYPGWIGADRIVVMPPRKALPLEIFQTND